ncbi:hypothetical protein FRB96_000048 [Tulasnella sp. 330]|nr:hypothetical protein FRB96_000048 [Tulasnella sp. 330]KAG8884052.1 hypothetical protein FRB97_005274 [Tulasnella sp. 331]KAG8890516.1 hypothetical protein FRB98_007863 [Tulasnella sp. 332]
MLARPLRCLRIIHRTFGISHYSFSITTHPNRNQNSPTYQIRPFGAQPLRSANSFSEPPSSPPVSLDINVWWKSLEARIEAHQETRRLVVLPRDLVLLLIELIDSYPRQTFAQINQRHEQYPHLQSNDSFNLLLELACRSPHPESFRSTWETMQRDGFGDFISRRLYVRHLVRHGNMAEAVALVDLAEGTIAQRELLWEIVQVPEKLPRRYLASEVNAQKLTPPKLPDDVSLQALKSVLSASLNGASSLFAQSAIAYLLYLHRFRDAFNLTRHIIYFLPENPSPRALSSALSFIHKLLELPPATISKRPSPGVPHAQKVLHLLAIHPQLRPNATTMAYTLEWYRWRLHRGRIAYSLLREWKARWGEQVEDSRVRYKIASFALEDRNVILARKMINREYAARRTQMGICGAAERAARDWERPRNDDLWNGVLKKYEEFDRKRKWRAEQGVWSTEDDSRPAGA